MVRYEEKEKTLLILSTTTEALEKAKLLIDIHFRNIKTKGLLSSHNEETSKKLEVRHFSSVGIAYSVQSIPST